jgi:hypothetical protein
MKRGNAKQDASENHSENQTEKLLSIAQDYDPGPNEVELLFNGKTPKMASRAKELPMEGHIKVTHVRSVPPESLTCSREAKESCKT